MEPIFLPAGKASNILRGAFGILFREAAEAAGRPALYHRIFQPTAADLAAEKAPSGLEDAPRPFVFRAGHLDGKTLARGSDFYFDFHLFDSHLFQNAASGADTISAILTAAFARLAETGIGPLKAKAQLTAVDERPVRISFPTGAAAAGTTTTGAAVASAPPEPGVPNRITIPDRLRHLRIQFVTPTELKSEGRTVELPEFGILIARIRDRVSTLRALYGPGPLAVDFTALASRADAVRITRCAIDRVEVERRSSRTGQRHGIGGFVGEVEYEGNIAEFVPYLEAARWTGVGRHTVWGNGELAYTAS